MQLLRQEYASCLRETESLLEQKEHSALQQSILREDQLCNPQAFRSANSTQLNQDEMRASLPWAVELWNQQNHRRNMVAEIARLMGDVGTSEKIGKHRKLVAIATGIKEVELDYMSGELLESLMATQSVVGGGPTTPVMGTGLVVA